MGIRSKILWLYTALTVAYGATLLVPRKLSTLPALPATEQLIVAASVFISLAIIWFVAFYGSQSLRSYAHMIKGSEDGRFVRILATGLFIVALGLPISSIALAIVNILAHNESSIEGLAIIVRNYINMIFPLAGFMLINYGAYGLSQLSRHRPRFRASQFMVAVFVAVSVAYCYAVMTSPNIDDIYHLPLWALMFTLVAPYIYTWYVGLLAAYEIHLYSRKAPGKLYRQNWNMMAFGITAIVAVQVLTQYLTTFTIRLQSLQYMRLFLTVYVLLAAMSIGYILIAASAKRLKRIEEV